MPVRGRGRREGPDAWTLAGGPRAPRDRPPRPGRSRPGAARAAPGRTGTGGPRKVSHLVVMLSPMTTQLRLLDPTQVDWRLDEQTKAVGRRGLAKARQTLLDARRAAEGRGADRQSAA